MASIERDFLAAVVQCRCDAGTPTLDLPAEARPATRSMGAVRKRARGADRINWIGLWTLYKREVHRFLKVAAQTVTGPVVSTLLFLAVFSVALGRRTPPAQSVAYLQFLAPGLIMMTMAQNAFANTASSILIAKVQGNISDFLMAPLSPGELVCGFALGSVTRGRRVGLAGTLASLPFWPSDLPHPASARFDARA